MSTSLTDQLSSLTTTLNLVFGIVLIIFGTIGGIFNILVFFHSNLRKTSCGIYFLSASISGVALVLTGQLGRLVTLSSTSSFLTTFLYCQLRIYLTNIFGLITRGLIVLASFDRLLFCSLNARTRALCNVKITIRVILILILLSFILPIHVLLSYELRLPSRSCRPDISWLSTYDLSYQYIFVVILPSGLMSIFSLMLVFRLRAQRVRLARELRRRDKQLIWMLLAQVLFYTIIHIPIPVNMTYNRLTLYLTKTRDRIAIENFFSFLVNSEIMYFYFSMTFFLHILISPTFREEFIKIWKRPNRTVSFGRQTTRVMPLNRSYIK